MSKKLSLCILAEHSRSDKSMPRVLVFRSFGKTGSKADINSFMGTNSGFSRTGSCVPEDFHLNHESILPPVDCELLISIPSWEGEPVLLRAIRPGFIENKGDDVTYELQQKPVLLAPEPQAVVFIGNTIKGRFKWTYP